MNKDLPSADCDQSLHAKHRVKYTVYAHTRHPDSQSSCKVLLLSNRVGENVVMA